MARALIVACGCRGRALGARLAAEGWAVRGTGRDEDRLGEIEAAGIEAALADPALPGTVLDLVADVAVIYWLLGSAAGPDEEVAGMHGEQLEHLLRRLVDTPVRGFAYEAAGSAPAESLRRGTEIVEQAGAIWRIPVALITADSGDHTPWLEDAAAAARILIPCDEQRATSND
jgi:uncharacterized protein YbjT (DUF2867 family)